MMIWEEVLIDRNLTDDEIKTTISKLFSNSSTDILVVDDIEEADVGKHVRILCERTPVRGHFSIKLSIYLCDPELEQIDNKTVIGKFCDILHCKCLIPDDSVNPYSMLLVQSSVSQQPVSLDSERLDEYEEYVIKNPLPSDRQMSEVS